LPAFVGEARQLQGVEGIARQGDGQQHILSGDRGQPVGGIFVAALHADGRGVGAEGHQGRGGKPGQVDAVAKPQDVDLARRGQAGDEGVEAVAVVVARGGGQVAAGALQLLVQAEGTPGRWASSLRSLSTGDTICCKSPTAHREAETAKAHRG